jgi:hypothetical protein
MEPSLLTILPNLSIGVVAVAALVYISLKFLEHLDKRSIAHEASMTERETQIRIVEKEVRTKVLDQLQQNSMVMADTVKSHERLMTILDKK